MITKEQIGEIIQDKITEDGNFIVDINVTPGNKIIVHLDNVKGLSIDYCVAISRFIESNFDREEEDFELEVSTPGLGKPFKVIQQYHKNIGREVEVRNNENEIFKGLLTEVKDECFVIKEEKKVAVEGKKKKQLKEFIYEFKFIDVKSVKDIISF